MTSRTNYKNKFAFAGFFIGLAIRALAKKKTEEKNNNEHTYWRGLLDLKRQALLDRQKENEPEKDVLIMFHGCITTLLPRRYRILGSAGWRESLTPWQRPCGGRKHHHPALPGYTHDFKDKILNEEWFQIDNREDLKDDE